MCPLMQLLTGLEESGDGQRGDGPVGVGDEVLQVQVAGRHCGGMGHCHLHRKQ